MDTPSLPDGPVLAYLRAVVTALGPHAGSNLWVQLAGAVPDGGSFRLGLRRQGPRASRGCVRSLFAERAGGTDPAVAELVPLPGVAAESDSDRDSVC